MFYPLVKKKTKSIGIDTIKIRIIVILCSTIMIAACCIIKWNDWMDWFNYTSFSKNASWSKL